MTESYLGQIVELCKNFIVEFYMQVFSGMYGNLASFMFVIAFVSGIVLIYKKIILYK